MRDKYYPILKIPVELSEVKTSIPRPHLYCPIEPKKPERLLIGQPIPPTKPATDFGCLKYVLFFLALGLFMFWISTAGTKSSDAFQPVLFGIGFVGFGCFLLFSLIKGGNDDSKDFDKKLIEYNIALQEYPKRIETENDKHIAALRKYELDYEEYKLKLTKYNEHLEEIKSKDYIESYRKALLLSILNEGIMATESDDSTFTRKGVSEDSFFLFTKKPFKI